MTVNRTRRIPRNRTHWRVYASLVAATMAGTLCAGTDVSSADTVTHLLSLSPVPESGRAADVLQANSTQMLSPSSSGETNNTGDSNTLWKLVHDECVPRQLANQNPPDPCAKVNIASGIEHGDAVLKSKDDAREFLLIPTAKITGIEDPAILATDATNYFTSAWTARSFVENYRKEIIPRNAMSLEINPATHRSQNQLHIHIDCVTEQVFTTLKDNESRIAKSWAPFPKQLAGHNFDAMVVSGDNLSVNPFKLLSDSIPDSKDKQKIMADSTLAVVGKTDNNGNPDGFVLLKGQGFAGEDIQDHKRCPAQ